MDQTPQAADQLDTAPTDAGPDLAALIAETAGHPFVPYCAHLALAGLHALVLRQAAALDELAEIRARG